MSRFLFAAAALMLCVACDHTAPVQPPPPENHSPTANIGGPYTALEGTAVPFNARASTDLDGDSLRYTWDFGDGIRSAGVVASHVYADNGTYVATVVVKDEHDLADTATAMVTIENAAPEIGTLVTPLEPQPINTPVAIETRVVDAGSRDALTVTIAWGDGTTGSYGAPHAYVAPGQYTLTVTARDKDGAQTTRVAEHPISVYDPNANQAEQAGYEVIDLGTLGGNAALPTAFNDSGQVVGVSRTASGELHAFLWDHGVMRDLAPDLSGSQANVIANSGAIAGVDFTQPWATDLLLWRDGIQIRLPSLAFPGDGRSFRPVAVSDAGDVLAWQSNGERYRSAVWHHDVAADVGSAKTPPSTEAMAMNGRGAVVGGLMTGEYAGDEIRHAFLWLDGTMRDLGLLADQPCDTRDADSLKSCGQSVAMAINANGEMLGISSSPVRYESHVVLWREGGINDLGVGQPVALNDAGDILVNRGSEAVIWRAGNPQSLGSLGGNSTAAVALNGSGVVTGSSYTAWRAEHVFVWNPDNQRMADLGLGPDAIARGARAVAINARGDILGYTYVEPPCFVLGLVCWGQPLTTHAILWRRRD